MMKRFSFFIILVFFLCASNAFGLNKNYIEKRIKNVQAAIMKKKEGYLKLRAQYVGLIKQARKTKIAINTLKRKIDVNKKGVVALNKKIDILKKEIGSLGSRLAAQKKELYNEFDKYYKYSMTSSYYKKGVWYEYMSLCIVRYMQNKIKKYVSQRLYLKNRLETLSVYVDKKRKILNRIQAQQNSLKRQMSRLSALTKESLRKRREYLRQIKQLSIEQDRLQSVLKKIIEEERKKALEEARRKKLLEKRKKKTTVFNKTQPQKFISYGLKKSFKGLLQPPVRGKIVDTFGKKYDTVFKVYTRNDGIDIKAAKGSCVRAVYGGKIDYVGSLPGYGGVIIINHLNGYYTVYGGVSALVKTGQIVKMQECIGRMQKDRLHFELRKHAEAINPLKLLNRRFLR